MSRICIAGKNNIAVNAMNYLKQELHIVDICAVMNQTDSGVDEDQKSYKKYCTENQIPICNLSDLYNDRDLIFISLEFDKIIVPDKFQTTHLINIHFSLLPQYKGMFTSAIPILCGEKKSGVTMHKIDAGIDTGDVIDFIEFNVDLNETAYSLYQKYIQFGTDLFKKNIQNLINKQYIYFPQSALNSSYYSRQFIDYKNLHININQTAYQIHNQLRAYIFPAYQLPCIYGKSIYKSILTDQKMEAGIIEDNLELGCFKISGIDRYIVQAYYKG